MVKKGVVRRGVEKSTLGPEFWQKGVFLDPPIPDHRVFRVKIFSKLETGPTRNFR
jgi:hypothetical protein